jgi:hypothetical protein
VNEQERPSPIEVWLTQKNMAITCMEVREDESARLGVQIDSLSMRGAQREATGWYINQGYEPVGRWEFETEGESFRRFKLKPASPEG